MNIICLICYFTRDMWPIELVFKTNIFIYEQVTHLLQFLYSKTQYIYKFVGIS